MSRPQQLRELVMYSFAWREHTTPTRSEGVRRSPIELIPESLHTTLAEDRKRDAH